MGTGGRAAVDGVMASSMAETLIKAGVGYDSALRLINSALMGKMADESLATLDIATVDLVYRQGRIQKSGWCRHIYLPWQTCGLWRSRHFLGNNGQCKLCLLRRKPKRERHDCRWFQMVLPPVAQTG